MERASHEEAWQRYLQAERTELRLRRGGLLARLLGAPLPDEQIYLVTAVAALVGNIGRARTPREWSDRATREDFERKDGR